MDSFAVGYLVHRFFYRIYDFFRHWYVGGSRVIAHSFTSTLERIDRSLAVKITLEHFFEPLYKDYTAIGRILGVIFRSGRVIVGIAVYALVTVCFVAAYLVWLAIPPALLFFSLGKA